jgi:hypothetical protein
MSGGGIDAAELLQQLVDHAKRLGGAERVAGHEPKNAPGLGVTIAFWVSGIEPVPGRSGLDVTSIRVDVTCRIYTPMLDQEPDRIDRGLLQTTAKLMEAYTGDFELRGSGNRHIDLLGESGTQLGAQAGYVSVDTKQYRIFNLTIPVLIDNTWAQVN